MCRPFCCEQINQHAQHVPRHYHKSMHHRNIGILLCMAWHCNVSPVFVAINCTYVQANQYSNDIRWDDNVSEWSYRWNCNASSVLLWANKSTCSVPSSSAITRVKESSQKHAQSRCVVNEISTPMTSREITMCRNDIVGEIVMCRPFCCKQIITRSVPSGITGEISRVRV